MLMLKHPPLCADLRDCKGGTVMGIESLKGRETHTGRASVRNFTASLSFIWGIVTDCILCAEDAGQDETELLISES